MIKPRLSDASSAELTLCLKNSFSPEVKVTLAPDCKTEPAIMKELERQYGVKEKIITEITEEVLKI